MIPPFEFKVKVFNFIGAWSENPKANVIRTDSYYRIIKNLIKIKK
jgi:hypothetical protein